MQFKKKAHSPLRLIFSSAHAKTCAMPRTLKLPVRCSDSSFSDTFDATSDGSHPETSGVRRTCGDEAMRRHASAISAAVTSPLAALNDIRGVRLVPIPRSVNGDVELA